MSRDSIRRAVRTFIITTLALFIPGLLGWLNALTEWARSEGQKPFPDGHGLAYLGVSAITAGVVAIVNLLWNAVEDGTGKALLRTVPPRRLGEGGYGVPLVQIIIGLVLLFVVIWFFTVVLPR